jgi:lipoprotein-releasing system permease protein
MINFPLIPVIFSSGLVRQMGLHVGEVVFLASWSDKPGPDGKYYPREHPFVVVGSFRTRDTQVDLTRSLVPREELREFAGLETHAHKIVIAVAPGHDENEVRDRLRIALSPLGIGSGSVDTWADRKVVLLRAVENERRIMNVVLFFMVVVAAFNLLVTLFMMVSEKVRDIGVLSSLGCSPSGIAAIFLNCGLIITLGGLVSGVVLGLLLTWNINPIHDFIRDLTGLSLFNEKIYNFVEIPSVVDYTRIFLFSVATFGCTMFMTLFPSYRAARLDPVEALRRG